MTSFKQKLFLLTDNSCCPKAKIFSGINYWSYLFSFPEEITESRLTCSKQNGEEGDIQLGCPRKEVMGTVNTDR